MPGAQSGPSVVSGSHIDSQRPGGRYDGSLGAVAALIALGALREQVGPSRRTLEALSMCEEESSRFPGANFWGARAITGQIEPHELETLRDYDGETISKAMQSVNLDPGRIAEARREDIDSFIELHIEQGQILEHTGLPVGVVSGITGIRHTVVEIEGRSDHAGAAPMDLRRDPIPAFAAIASGVIDTARHMGRPAVTTVGRVVVEPNLPAIVPDRVTFTIDARHPSAAERERLYTRHAEIIDHVASEFDLPVRAHIVLDQPPRPCDPDLTAVITRVAQELSLPVLSLHSGAGHDSQVMANIARVAMIFVRSEGGRSHTPAEFTSIEDATLGITLLANALYRIAY
jgi:allantoate deiminase